MSAGGLFSFNGHSPQMAFPASARRIRRSARDPLCMKTRFVGSGSPFSTIRTACPTSQSFQHFPIADTYADATPRLSSSRHFSQARKRALRDSFVIHPATAKAGVSRPGPLCLPNVVRGATPERCCNLFRLSSGFGAATPCPCQPFVTTDLRSPTKAVEDHVAHVVVSKSAEARWPRLVSN